MSRYLLLILIVLVASQAGRACDENNGEQLAAAARQESVDYLANAYGFFPNPWDAPMYYQQNTRVPEYAGPYEGRTPFRPSNPNPFSKYLNKNNAEEQPEGRFGSLGASILNAGLFNNRYTASGTTFRPFAGISNRLPIQLNPNFGNSISAFDSCTSPSGESGICSPGAVCSLFGGRPSGSCLLGGVCCINAITTCGGTVTLNNTYWQSPTTAVTSPSTCTLTVKLDTKLVEQKKPICQVRLDFVSFTIGQSDANGLCTDSFQVGGATNKVPTICGVNSGQHMYLTVPSSDLNPTDLQLLLNFGSTATTRSWNIKVSMLPCGASYLAPTGCLQYYTSATGRIKSFNWEDINSANRQLANQDYSVCFRSEVLNAQKANQLCFTVCSGATYPFTITGDATAAGPLSASGTHVLNTANAATATCLYDYLLIAGARDTSTTTGQAADRYCGLKFNPAVLSSGIATPGTGGSATSITVCTQNYPFIVSYHTDGTEAIVTTGIPTAAADNFNAGFCLDFQEKYM